MNNSLILGIQLSEFEIGRINYHIAEFFEKEFGQTFSKEDSSKIANFVIDDIAPVIYNKALDQAKKTYDGAFKETQDAIQKLYKSEKR
ncbi:MAG: DUF2164 family protein [Anaerotignaceae bacterium]